MRHLQTSFIGGVKFTSKVTGKTYFINEDISCNSDKCKDEYTEYIMNTYECTKPRFSEKSSDIKIRTFLVPLDILVESVYVPLLLLDMSKFKSLSKSTRKTHRKLKNYFDIEKDTGPYDEQYL